MLFSPIQSPTNLLYSKLNVLKLDHMINMEFAKSMFKFNTQILPEHFDEYFMKLVDVHQYTVNTRQKHRKFYFYQLFISTEQGKKTLQ